MSSDFVHLHVHSEYSLLDGLGKVKDLVAHAAQYNQPALALTDHGVMHGAVEFYRTCKAQGVKPIIGMEGYMTLHGRSMTDREPHKDKARHHILLLAENMTGYRNLLQISTAAQLEGYYYKPRIDADFLAAHSEGLICTTGCMAAEVPYWLNSEDRAPNIELAKERLRWYVDVFGPERFYVELQEHGIPELRNINKQLVDWAKPHGLELLVTNDVHYPTAQDAVSHDVLLCVQTSSLVTEQNRMRFSDEGYYLKTRAELEATFRPFLDLPASAFTNSLKIAEMCNVDLEDSSYHLPDLPPGKVPESYTYAQFLRHLTDEGLKRRYGSDADSAEVQARKEHELNIITSMNFEVYFLIVWDLCEFARRENIWWNVRGSGAGSIVAYALGITMVDPLANHLIFERFLNPGRVSMPDFDLDYPDDQRERMIRYTIDTYGEDNVAQIVSFGRMKARAAIRDVGRAQDVELSEVDQIAKLVPAIPGKPVTIDKVLTDGNEFHSSELSQRYQQEKQVSQLIDTARSLEGAARHASIHAAAVIVTDKPLVNYVPLMRPQGSVITKAVTQFEFPICESIGLLKVDFLGLSTLTIMRRAAELIEARHGKSYTLDNIPIEDPKAFELLASGNVTGVFQVEGAGMRRILTEMRPSKFDHIIAVLSLYRPGPLQYIPNYIARMHGKEEVEYRHPMLEPILSDTYGIIVYQEQIMRIATELASYTASEADFMRKAVAKKKEKELQKHRKMMLEGGQKNGIPEATMLEIFSDIEFFARYGFNKAHAADYAVITCQTAYLKAHYPVEYMAALLTVEHNNTDKVGILLEECRTLNIDVLPPSVNHSYNGFRIEETDEQTSIRFGLGAIKNVGEGPIEAILSAREDEPFADLESLCERVDLRNVGKRALESLVKVGALDEFGERPLLLAVIERMIRLSTQIHQAAAIGQMTMFDMAGFEAPEAGSLFSPEPEIEDISTRELLNWEKELIGAYISSHPLQALMSTIKDATTCLCGDVETLAELGRQKRGASLAGLITAMRTITTKKGDPMAFVTIEDIQSTREVVVFPRTYAATKEILVEGEVILVRGKVDAKDPDNPKILADSITNELQTLTPAEPAPLNTGYEVEESPVFYNIDEDMDDDAFELQHEPPPPPPAPPTEPSLPNGNGVASTPSASTPPPQPAQAAESQSPAPLKPPKTTKTLHITIPRTGNPRHDVQLLENVFHTLRSNQGQHAFYFLIPQNGHHIKVGYDFGVAYTPELQAALHNLLNEQYIHLQD